LEQLVSQRVYQLVGGYEDANDSNQLRHDPIYKLACGRLPVTAQVERLRSMLIKGAARVRVSARRVLVELAAFCPYATELRLITQQLVASQGLMLS
jgi:hypothetical protein